MHRYKFSNDVAEEGFISDLIVIPIVHHFFCSAKKFANISLHPDFHRHVSYDEIPREPSRSPSSVEAEFMYKCQSADNPEVFYRMLMVSITFVFSPF